MTTVKVEVRIPERTLKKLADTIQRDQAEKVWQLATRAAPIMETEVVKIIKAEMFWDRDPDRRKPHTTKLVNSFVAVVDGRRGLPNVAARLTTKPGVNAKKVAALEHGYGSHEIPPGRNGFLGFPRSELEDAVNQARNAYGRNNFVTKNSVVNPGHEGFHMMRRARDHAVQIITL